MWKIPEAYRLALEEADEAEEEAAERVRLEAELEIPKETTIRSKESEPVQKINGDSAEEKFIAMLDEHGIDYTWTWDRAIRDIILEDAYTVLTDARERRAAFDKQVAETRREAGEIAKQTIEKRRNDFVDMLKRSDIIKSYSRWKYVCFSFFYFFLN